MKESILLKVRKLGKWGKIICSVLAALAAILCLALLVFMLAAAAIPQELSLETQVSSLVRIHPADKLADFLNKFSPGAAVLVKDCFLEGSNAVWEGNMLEFEAASAIAALGPRQITLAFGLALLSALFLTIPLLFAVQLCRAIEHCESPFSQPVIHGIQAFAFSLLPLSLTGSLDHALEGMFFGVSTPLGIDFAPILLVLAVLALAQIFKYGAMLQLESDETL